HGPVGFGQVQAPYRWVTDRVVALVRGRADHGRAHARPRLAGVASRARVAVAAHGPIGFGLGQAPCRWVTDRVVSLVRGRADQGRAHARPRLAGVASSARVAVAAHGPIGGGDDGWAPWWPCTADTSRRFADLARARLGTNHLLAGQWASGGRLGSTGEPKVSAASEEQHDGDRYPSMHRHLRLFGVSTPREQTSGLVIRNIGPTPH